MAKPPGTRTPAAPSARVSSPSEAFLPPTDERSARPMSENQRTNGVEAIGELLRRRAAAAGCPPGCGELGGGAGVVLDAAERVGPHIDTLDFLQHAGVGERAEHRGRDLRFDPEPPR